MKKIVAAAAALAALTTTSAFAQVLINPGIYTVTTEYTGLTDGPAGLCTSAGIYVGETTTSLAYVSGGTAGSTIHRIEAQPAPTTDSTVQVNNLTCDYGALTSTVVAAPGSVAYNGGATCTASYSQALVSAGIGPSATYTITAGTSGSSTINSVIPENAKDAKGVTTPLTKANSFKITSTGVTVTLTNPAAGPICTLSLDTLFVRSGV
jgi:hypothetical protein